MSPSPNTLPPRKPLHASRQGGYVTESAGFRKAVAESVAPRIVATPKAIRVTPTPIVNPVRVVASPVTVRQATPEESARLASRKVHSAWDSRS